jgi:LemA protein
MKFLKILMPLLVIGLIVEGVSIQRDMSLAYQDVELAMSQVQNVLNRQAELIPNLAEVAKGYAKHEQDTFAKVSAFRSKAAQMASTSTNAVMNSPDMQKQLAETQAAASGALLALNAVREAYPELKANENYRSLMAELSGSINRVSVERRKSQQAVQIYNKKIVQFPTNVVAGIIGYHALPFYQASEADQHAPRLNMTFN